MSKYLIIESRSPFDVVEPRNDCQMVADLANSGHDVTLFMVENGVVPVRSHSESTGLADLRNVRLRADSFSLNDSKFGIGSLN